MLNNLSLTLKCNNRCIFCNRLALKAQIDTKEIEPYSILKSHKTQNRNITLNGGEIAIQPDFFDILSHCQELGYEEIRLATNGRIFSYLDFSKKTLKNGIKHFFVSLYSSNENEHDAITQINGSCRQTIKGLQNLILLGAKIYLTITVSKFNYKSVRATIKDLYKVGIRYFIISDIITHNKSYLFPYEVFTSSMNSMLLNDNYADAVFIFRGFPICIFREYLIDDLDPVLKLKTSPEKIAKLERNNLNKALKLDALSSLPEAKRNEYLNKIDDLFVKTTKCLKCPFVFTCNSWLKARKSLKSLKRDIPGLLIDPMLPHSKERIKDMARYVASQYNSILINTTCLRKNCRHCFEKQKPPDMQMLSIQNASFESVKESINYLDPNKNIINLGFMHGKNTCGEISDQPDLLKILSFVRKRYKNALINVFSTCGLFLTENNIKYLSKIGNVHLAIHVVSSNPNSARDIMPSQGKVFFKNLKLLQKSPITFSFNFVSIPHIFSWAEIKKSILEFDSYSPLAFHMHLYSYTKYATQFKIPDKDYLNEYIEFSEHIRTKMKGHLFVSPEAISQRINVVNSPFFSSYKTILKKLNPNIQYLLLVSEIVYKDARVLFNAYPGVKVKAVKNHYFAGNIVVGGLLTVHDYIEAIKGEVFDIAFISSQSFDNFGKDLSGKHFSFIESTTGKEIEVVKNESKYIWTGFEKVPSIAIHLAVSRAEFLQQAIESVINQSYKNWSLLIMVDLIKTDKDDLAKIKKIINEYAHHHSIKLYYNSRQRGIGNIRKEMIKITYSLGIKYFCVLDDDDLLDNLAIQELTNKINENTNFSLIRTGIGYLNARGEICGHINQVIDRKKEYGMTCDIMNVGHLYCVNLDKYKKTDGIKTFAEINHAAHDIDLFLKMEEVGEIITIHKILYYKREFLETSVLNNIKKEDFNRVATKYVRNAIKRRGGKVGISQLSSDPRGNLIFRYKYRNPVDAVRDSFSGTSRDLLDDFVQQAIKKIAPRTVIDFGAGKGKYGFLLRSSLSERFFIAAVEIYKPLYKILSEIKIYNSVSHCDLLKWLKNNKKIYDVAIFGDVLEHLDKEKIKLALKMACTQFKFLIIIAPLNDSSQDEIIGGNKYSIHKSRLLENDFNNFHILKKDIKSQDNYYKIGIIIKGKPENL
ncbi:MAG: radical SAM protein [Candidatus Omnitrophota bacterium]